jgi:hypothetical protein
MHSRFSLRLGLGVLAVLALFVVPVLAHHGWSGNSDEEFELTGTVQKSVSLAGPHATMKIMANGQVWDLTLAPAARTESAGLKEGAIPVGATVTAHGHRSRDPKKFEIKTERVTWNGKTYAVYPDRK